MADHVAQSVHGFVDSRFTVDAGHLDEAIGRLHAAAIHTLTVTPPNLDALFLNRYRDAPNREGAPASSSALSGRWPR